MIFSMMTPSLEFQVYIFSALWLFLSCFSLQSISLFWLLTLCYLTDQDRKVDPRDLRLKLQKKHHGLQSRLGGVSLGGRDLREKLSGTKNPQPRNTNLQKSTREATRPAVKNGSGETKSETRAALNKAVKKKPQQAR